MTGSDSRRPLVVWRIIDGKPGHERQSRGLSEALARLARSKTIDVSALPTPNAISAWVVGRSIVPSTTPRPDLIICAGHATHLTALAARRRHGGRIVVLMKPSLPLRWFELCIAPEHDAVAGPNVISTRGALNDIVATTDKDPSLGLILLGGPSDHGRWNTDAVSSQVRSIVEHDQRRWVIAGSRRTPAETLQGINRFELDRIDVMHWQDAPSDWLREMLGKASTVWVTQDSVSMLYEALSSGASVGLLRLPAIKRTRVRSGVEQLIKEGLILDANDGLAANRRTLAGGPLQEAQRCAQLIYQRWFDKSAFAAKR